MEFNDKIYHLRKRHNLTLEDVAKVVGVSKSTVKKWETGAIANMRRDKIALLAKALHTTPGYLMGWEDDIVADIETYPIATTKRPLVGTIACGTPVLAVENIEAQIDVPIEFASADFALRCVGDSMDGGKYPIRDGSIVYIKEQPVVDDGQIAAVLIGEEATLKIVYWNEQAHTLTLLPQNPSYSPIVVSGPDLELEGVRILGRAIGYTASIA